MLSCTFFGHRDCPATIRPKLREVLVALIEHQGVAQFYVGRQGAFDALVRGVLDELAAEYPHIRYAVVLERLPGKQNGQHSGEGSSHTMLPEGLETVHPRWAIARRNAWMLDKADYVVAYVTHSWGGAAQFVAKAARQKKKVIHLSGPSAIRKKP